MGCGFSNSLMSMFENFKVSGILNKAKEEKIMDIENSSNYHYLKFQRKKNINLKKENKTTLSKLCNSEDKKSEQFNIDSIEWQSDNEIKDDLLKESSRNLKVNNKSKSNLTENENFEHFNKLVEENLSRIHSPISRSINNISFETEIDEKIESSSKHNSLILESLSGDENLYKTNLNKNHNFESSIFNKVDDDVITKKRKHQVLTKKSRSKRTSSKPTGWEKRHDSLFENKKFNRRKSSISLYSDDSTLFKKPNTIYLVFGNNFLKTPKIKIIESHKESRWAKKPKKTVSELDVYTGVKNIVEDEVIQTSTKLRSDLPIARWNNSLNQNAKSKKISITSLSIDKFCKNETKKELDVIDLEDYVEEGKNLFLQ